MIKQTDGKWYLYSKDGDKILGGPYDTEEEAIKREEQVLLFKDEEASMKGRGVVKKEVGECGVEGMLGIPMNITSFAGLKSSLEVLDFTKALDELNEQFSALSRNILLSDNPDKIGALYALVTEYAEMLPQPGSETNLLSMQSSEALTHKSAVKAAVRAILGLLEEKEIPNSVMQQVKALAGTFKRTWGDLKELAGSEDPEPAAEVEGPLHSKIFEAFPTDTSIDEVEVQEQEGGSSALDMQVVLIRPGWGNTRDNHYYPRDVLANASTTKLFAGKKMYESDHKPSEKSTRTWVSTITGIEGFTDDGAPIARVTVHDPSFAQRIKNLQSKGLIGSMECSILADAIAERAVFQEGGRKGKKILNITEVESVDWVTRAGAGGHALKVMENEGEVEELNDTPQEEPSEGDIAMLTPEQVKEFLDTLPNVPSVMRTRIEEATYETPEQLESACAREVEYLKELTGSGKPFSVGETKAPAADETPEKMTREQIKERLDQVDRAFGILE